MKCGRAKKSERTETQKNRRSGTVGSGMMVKKISRDAFFWESQGACAPRREPFPDALARQQLAVPCTTHSFSSRRATDPTAIASYKLQVRLDEQALRDPQGKALASRRAFRWWLR